MSDTWLKITGDSKVVDIRSVGKKGYYCKRTKRPVSPQEAGISYMIKYATKGIGVDHVPNADIAFPLPNTEDDWKSDTQISTHLKVRDGADWDDPDYAAARSIMGLLNDESVVVDRRVCCIEGEPLTVSQDQSFWLNHVHKIIDESAFWRYAESSMQHLH